jgi:The Golgi pH Regulator (GPHR) Family N-terminal
MSFFITGHRKSQRPIIRARFFLSLVPVITYLFAFSHIPLPASLASSDTTTIALSRLIVLGTIILGLLSGFGVISNSWRFLPFISQSRYVCLFFFLGLDRGFGFVSETRSIFIFFIFFLYRGVPSEQEIDAAHYSLSSIRNDMRSRKEEAARREGSTVRLLSLFHHNSKSQNHSGRINFMVLPRRILISRR